MNGEDEPLGGSESRAHQATAVLSSGGTVRVLRCRRPSRTLVVAMEGERGAVLVLVAVLLVVLFAVAALVFDLGHLYTVRRELQNSADASALAGAIHFDGTLGGIARAREEALAYARRHLSDHRQSEIDENDIVFGHWSPASGEFTPFGSYPSSEQVAAVNAIRVLDRRDGEGAVMLRLAPVMGRREAGVSSAAVAITGGPSTECAFPMVVPACSLDEALESGDCQHCFIYQDQPGAPSNSGWSTLGSTDGLGVPHISDLVEQACFDGAGNPAVDPETGECSGQCAGVITGDEADVHTGNMMSQGASNFCPMIQQILERDGTPQPFTVRVPVLETDSSPCAVPNRGAVAGFASVEILGARCGNNDPGVFAAETPDCGPPPSGKIIIGRLRCDLLSDQPPGGGYFGTQTRRTRLVR